jgi:transcription termination factor Rho
MSEELGRKKEHGRGEVGRGRTCPWEKERNRKEEREPTGREGGNRMKLGTESGYKNEGQNKEVPGRRRQDEGDKRERNEANNKDGPGGKGRDQDEGDKKRDRNEGNNKEGTGKRGQEGGGRMKRTGREIRMRKHQEGRDRMRGTGSGTAMKETTRNGQEGEDWKEEAGRRGQGERNRKWIKKYRKQ